jgi:hypothetical protein
MKSEEVSRKFVREFLDDNKKVVARWYYDLNKFPNGPILVENLDLPKKESAKKKKI